MEIIQAMFWITSANVLQNYCPNDKETGDKPWLSMVFGGFPVADDAFLREFLNRNGALTIVMGVPHDYHRFIEGFSIVM